MPVPVLAAHEILVRVEACAVCRTDLHVVDGELDKPRLPVIPGHEIVGRIVDRGAAATRFSLGSRVGIPWLGQTCGECRFCVSGEENLCDAPEFTGYTRDGGYAEFAAADERFCVPIPEAYTSTQAAPLLCAGLIGYRSLMKTGDAARIGIYGFGAAAHLVAQVAQHEGREIFAFTRPHDVVAQQFARELGVHWVGGSLDPAPVPLDAAIIFAPVGALVPQALRNVRKGGVVVCGGIHMTDIPQFPYELLWGERHVCSVANLTRLDAEQFMEVASKVAIQVHTEEFPLAAANAVLDRMRSGQLNGAAVLVPHRTATSFRT